MTTHPLAGAVKPTLEQLIDLIGEFGREVFYLLDDCETIGTVGQETHTITTEGLEKVSAILDRIDALPFEEPGAILGTGSMLQAAFKQTLSAPTPPADVAGLAAAASVMASMPGLPPDVRDMLSDLSARVAELEGERDSILRSHRVLNVDGSRLQHRAEAAEAALAAARDKALEEAAQRVHAMNERKQVVWANDIRAMKGKP